jgi:hypothetical protein
MRAGLAMMAALWGQAAVAEVFATPSGLEVRLFDVVLEAEADIARFRYHAPALAGGAVGYPEVAADIVWLCEAVALPALDANGWAAARITVTLADREVPFGEMDAEAIQFIDGFERRDARCLWEEY